MVSLIIPTYNRADELQRTFPAYAAQGDVSELIYVDDGSSDETPSQLAMLSTRDARVRVIRHLRRRGLPAARNTGVAAASAPYVCFGEDDAEPALGYVSTLLEHVRGGRCDVAAGRLFYGSPHDVGFAAPIERRRMIGRFSAKPDDDVDVPFLHALSLMRRELVMQVGFSERRYFGNYFREETDFYLRAACSGARIVFCPHTYVVHAARAPGARGTGGIWPDSRIEYRFWRHVNNLSFVLWNWKQVGEISGVWPGLSAMFFVLARLGGPTR